MSERPNTVLDERERVECGAAARRRHLIEQEYLHPVPSVSKIGTVLREYGLTHGRLGWNDDGEPRCAYDSTKKPKPHVTS
jgi:hypothetical protein